MHYKTDTNRNRASLALTYAKIIALLLMSTLDTEAQPGRLERLSGQAQDRWNVGLNSDVEYLFDTDLDGGGKFDLTRIGVSLDTTFIPDNKWRITLGSSYSFNKFDFTGGGGIAGLDPWENINLWNMSLRINYGINDSWGIFVSPLFSFSGESGARFWDSVTGGGIAGVTYSVGRKLVIGFGGIVRSRIEDDVIGFPIAYIRWAITERLTLSTLASGVRTEIGPEIGLNYDLGNGFSVGLSGGYEFRRFRLDSNGPFADGVGDVKGLPVWGRISYSAGRNITFNGYGGLIFLGNMELENRRGNRIEKDDFDPAPFIGGSINLKL